MKLVVFILWYARTNYLSTIKWEEHRIHKYTFLVPKNSKGDIRCLQRSNTKYGKLV